MDGRLERRLPLAEEDCYTTACYRSNSFVWVKPSNLKAEHISVMLLRAFDIDDRQLRHWLARKNHFLFCNHRDILLLSFMQQACMRVKSRPDSESRGPFGYAQDMLSTVLKSAPLSKDDSSVLELKAEAFH